MHTSPYLHLTAREYFGPKIEPFHPKGIFPALHHRHHRHHQPKLRDNKFIDQLIIDVNGEICNVEK